MKHSLRFLLLLLTFASGDLFAQAPACHFAYAVGDPLADAGYAVAADPNGSAIYTGLFAGTNVDFSGANDSLGMNALGPQDIFVVKYDSIGALEWAFQLGSPSSNLIYPRGINTDAAGNIYLSGVMSGSVDFDPGAGQFVLTSISPAGVVFLAKYSPAGALLWAFTLGGAQGAQAAWLAVSPAGDVSLLGAFSGIFVDFDPGPGTSLLTAAVGGSNLFLARYSPQGQYLWAFALPVLPSLDNVSIGQSPMGQLFVSGTFNGSNVDFDPGPGLTTLSATTPNQPFLASFTPAGSFLWAFSLDASIRSLSDDRNGGVLVAGDWTGSTDFDPGLGTAMRSALGGRDIFFAGYSAGGQLSWLRSLNGAGAEEARAIVSDASGTIYLAGQFQDSTDFDPGMGLYDLPAGPRRGFLAKYAPGGAFEWVFDLELGANEGIYGLAGDNLGRVFVTGALAGGPIDAAPGRDTRNVKSAGGTDVFASKYGEFCSNFWPTANVQSRNPACENQPVILEAIGGAFYSWTGPNGFASNQQYPFINRASFSMAGLYTVAIADANGCEDTAYVSLAVDPSPVAGLSSNSPICSGNTLTLNGTGNGSYAWSGPNGYSASTQNATLGAATVQNSGRYLLAVTNSFGCTDTLSALVVIHPLPLLSLAANTPCAGDSLRLFAGGAAVYQWSGPGAFSSMMQNPVLAGATQANAGTYSVAATDSNGCAATAQVMAQVRALPQVQAAYNGPFVCIGDTIVLTATGNASSYAWSGPRNFSSNQPVVSLRALNLQWAGVYRVSALAANGCSASDSVEVEMRACGVSIDEPMQEALQVAPNPVNSLLYVYPGEAVANGTLMLYNAEGKLLQRQALQNVSGRITLSVAHLAPGMYLLQWLDGKSARSARVAIVR